MEVRTSEREHAGGKDLTDAAASEGWGANDHHCQRRMGIKRMHNHPK